MPIKARSPPLDFQPYITLALPESQILKTKGEKQ